MKYILICAGYFYPHIGGGEKNIGELAHRLSEKGYQIDILTSNTNKALAEEQSGTVHIYRLPCWDALGGKFPIPKPSITGLRILFKIQKNKYDVINTQTRFFLTSLLGLILTKIKRIPLIHTERGSRHSVVSSIWTNIISKTYDHTIGALIIKSAKVNIGISEAAGSFLKHLGAKTIQIIPNGINVATNARRSSNWRQKLGISDNTLIITFVGRLINEKGVQDLICVFPNCQKTQRNLKLIIVGDGPFRKSLEDKASKSRSNGDIFFLGNKNIGDILDILATSDIFVNPSYSEGLPTSVMEAASVGLPIIATDVGGTREIIINNKTGVLVEERNITNLEESICQLIENELLRQNLGNAAKKFVTQTYNWDVITQRMIEIIEGVNSKK